MKDYLQYTVPLFLVSVVQFLLKYTDLFAVWGGIWAWEASTHKPLPMEIKWPLYFGAFVVSSFFVWRKEVSRTRAAEAALAAERKRTIPRRVFVENPESILERYGQRGARAERLLVPYLDRWIRVEGRFEGIADSLEGDSIFMSLILENGRRIQLRFSTDSRNRLQNLRAGQALVAVCQIHHGYGAGVFTLVNCEIVSTAAHRPAFARVS